MLKATKTALQTNALPSDENLSPQRVQNDVSTDAPDRLSAALNFSNELSNSILRKKIKRHKKRWNEAARAEKSSIIQKHKPWLRSTGPKTRAGKARSANNSFQHGLCCDLLRGMAEGYAAKRLAEKRRNYRTLTGLPMAMPGKLGPNSRNELNKICGGGGGWAV